MCSAARSADPPAEHLPESWPHIRRRAPRSLGWTAPLRTVRRRAHMSGETTRSGLAHRGRSGGRAHARRDWQRGANRPGRTRHRFAASVSIVDRDVSRTYCPTALWHHNSKTIEVSRRIVAVNLFNRNAWYHEQSLTFIASGQIGKLDGGAIGRSA